MLLRYLLAAFSTSVACFLWQTSTLAWISNQLKGQIIGDFQPRLSVGSSIAEYCRADQDLTRHLHENRLVHPFMTSQSTLARTISFSANINPPVHLSPDSKMSSTKTGRRRRSSSIIYQEPPESLEQISDQSALPNLNSQWVNAKGG